MTDGEVVESYVLIGLLASGRRDVEDVVGNVGLARRYVKRVLVGDLIDWGRARSRWEMGLVKMREFEGMYGSRDN